MGDAKIKGDSLNAKRKQKVRERAGTGKRSGTRR